jgi:hypothetical protein
MNEPLTKEQLATFVAPEPPAHFATRVLDAMPSRRLVSPHLWIALASFVAALLCYWGWMRASDPEAVALKPVEIQPKEEETTKPAAALILPPSTEPTTAPITVSHSEAAIVLYARMQFEEAMAEANKEATTGETELANRIKEFSALFATINSRYVAGDRASLFDLFGEALALDKRISSEEHFRARLLPLYMDCADALALEQYQKASKRTKALRELKMAYTMATMVKELNTSNAPVASTAILLSIEKYAEDTLRDADAELAAGRDTVAYSLYQSVRFIMPPGTTLHAKAKERQRKIP